MTVQTTHTVQLSKADVERILTEQAVDMAGLKKQEVESQITVEPSTGDTTIVLRPIQKATRKVVNMK